MTTLRADAERNRRRVLEAAIGVLRATPDAGMQEIADASEVGRSTLYRHFPTRDDLLEALFDRVVAQAHAAITARVDQLGQIDGETLLRALVADLVGLGQEAMFLYGAGSARVKGDADAAAEADMGRLVAALQVEGVLRTDIPPAWPGAALEGLLSCALVAAERGLLPRDDVAPLVADALLRATGA